MSSDPARSNAPLPRARRWKRPIMRCCSARPRARYAAAWAMSRPSCAARRSRATTPTAGICISPSSSARAARTCSCRTASANTSPRSAQLFSAACCSMPRPAPHSRHPTINGYRRFRPNSLAPDRATWGYDHRGVMVRVLGGHEDPATRLENRVGEPAANPYLYILSQIVAGLDGMEKKLDPGPADEEPYGADRPLLAAEPARRLGCARGRCALFRKELGEVFIDYFLKLKRNEAGRFPQLARAERGTGERRADAVGAERVFRFLLDHFRDRTDHGHAGTIEHGIAPRRRPRRAVRLGRARPGGSRPSADLYRPRHLPRRR